MIDYYRPYDFGIFHDEDDEDETKIFRSQPGLRDPILGIGDGYAELRGEGFFRDLGKFSKKLAKQGLAAGKVAYKFAQEAYQNPAVKGAVNSILEMAGEYAKEQLEETDVGVLSGPLIDAGLDHVNPKRGKKKKAASTKQASDEKKRTERAKPKKQPIVDTYNTVFPDLEGEGMGMPFTNPYLIGLNRMM